MRRDLRVINFGRYDDLAVKKLTTFRPRESQNFDVKEEMFFSVIVAIRQYMFGYFGAKYKRL